MSDLKVVFHVNENDRWPFTIRAARNLVSAGEGATVAVVANGAAIRSFSQLEADAARFAKIKELYDEGVRFVVCRTAMKERQVREELIPEYVEVVPVGIVEIAKLQAEGYGYIKA